MRDWAPGDERAIIALYERVFGKAMGPTESLRHWQWEFRDNPVPPIAIKLAWDGDRLVAQYTVSPLRLAVEGREVTACLSHDTMTDPDYQGQGLFVATATALYEDLARQGVAFVFGFPNANSIAGFVRRLGWTEVMPTPVLVRPVRVGKLLRDRTGSRVLAAAGDALARAGLAVAGAGARLAGSGWEVRVESGFGEWADAVWARCSRQHRVWVVRDRAYLNWRYVTRPESGYVVRSAWDGGTCAGWAITTDRVSEQGKVRFVMDAIAASDARGALDALLASVVADASRDGVEMISAIVGPGSPHRATYLRHLFVPLPEKYFPKELHFGCRPLTDDVGTGVLNDPSAWGLAWGDDDVM